MWIVGRARGLVEGAEETASGWWGKKGRVRAVVAVRWLWQAGRHAAALTTTPASTWRGGAERRRSAERSSTSSVRDHVPCLLHTAMLPSAPRWRLVWSAVSGRGCEREEISFGPGVVEWSSRVVVRDGLVGWIQVIMQE